MRFGSIVGLILNVDRTVLLASMAAPPECTIAVVNIPVSKLQCRGRRI
jgi:hypothetical protein